MIILQLYIIIHFVIQLNSAIGQKPTHKVANPKDWRIVENLAEEYPYIVALLNRTKDYMCSGIIVNRRTVLTSGSCIDPALYYIGVGLAVLSKSMDNNNLLRISSTAVHADYIFELKPSEPNVTRMHSNLGLVYSVLPNLEQYFPRADLGNYYASELQEKNLRVIGYGKINETNMEVLQQQSYHQTPCANPKWYYCICGVEYSSFSKTYQQEFGKGAPVFLDYDVVGIVATPCGSLELLSEGVKYNIFTVIGPYMPWIEKNPNVTKPIFRAHNKGVRHTSLLCILFITSKVIY